MADGDKLKKEAANSETLAQGLPGLAESEPAEDVEVMGGGFGGAEDTELAETVAVGVDAGDEARVEVEAAHVCQPLLVHGGDGLCC